MADLNQILMNIVQPTAADLAAPLAGERCQSLRCKGMYTNMGQPEGTRVTGDGHFWCAKTQRVFGPDDQYVGDGECRHSGRSCFEGD
ncbi:MAG: hypothetical protein EXS05_08810 [Planctomycetaceae bacterium]|nr:hypothetical protein [Planctomycetaceae bacterium]